MWVNPDLWQEAQRIVKGLVYDDGYDEWPIAIGKFGLMSLLATEDLPVSLNMARANREHATLACYISPKRYSLPYFMDRSRVPLPHTLTLNPAPVVTPLAILSWRPLCVVEVLAVLSICHSSSSYVHH